MMRYLGIDPGQSGAACVVGDDGMTVIAATAWKRSKSPPVLSDLIRDASAIAVEGVHVGKGRRSSLTLAEWRGKLLTQIPAGVTVYHPQPSEWRGKVLRRSNLRRDDAKRAALLAVRNAIGMPPEWADVDHMAEAWCLARYAWGMSR